MAKYDKEKSKKHGMTRKEIAEEMGISRQYVNSMLNTALKKMKLEAESLGMRERLL